LGWLWSAINCGGAAGSTVRLKPFKLRSRFEFQGHTGKVRLDILFIIRSADVTASRHFASTSNMLEHVVGFFEVPQLLPQSIYSNEVVDRALVVINDT
jgi:hypothetical protein